MLSADSRQLTFVFADNLQESKVDKPADESVGKVFLLHQLSIKEANESVTRADDDPSRLLERAASAFNLARALLNVARNKGAAGADGCSVEEVVDDSPRLIPKLRRELLSGTYRPGGIRRVWIPKPGGGQRGLGIPNVMDRVVQQVLLQVLEPQFEPTFHVSSHGLRPRRGLPNAITEAKKYLAEGYAWKADIDLSKFFDRVHHQRLLNPMAKQVEDGRRV